MDGKYDWFLRPERFADMDGGRVIPQQVQDIGDELAVHGYVMAGDGIDAAIALAVHAGEGSLDETVAHLDYIINQLSKYRSNLQASQCHRDESVAEWNARQPRIPVTRRNRDTTASTLKTLAAEISKNPKYTSPDDDLETTGGLIQAAILVIGRMADDLNAQSRMMKAGQFRD